MLNMDKNNYIVPLAEEVFFSLQGLLADSVDSTTGNLEDMPGEDVFGF